MIRGKVTGRVWSTRSVEGLPKGAFLLVDVGGAEIVAFDPLGCAEGEEVLVTQGSVAAAQFPQGKAPIDALIIGSIDQQ